MEIWEDGIRNGVNNEKCWVAQESGSCQAQAQLRI